VSDPYSVLGIAADSDDETIRRRYLELIKQNSPDHQPAKFAAIRHAYEQLKDLETRVRYRLFEAGKQETIEALIEEVACRSPRRRLGLKDLLAAVQEPWTRK
jgi:curved DNA-binding protein CbpA